MVRLIIRSFLSLLFAALIGSIVIFLMMHFLGGDVVTAILGKEAGPEDVSFMREELGLNRPLIVQYLDWLKGVLTGDLGTSYALGFDIFEQIRIRFAPTFMITFGTLLVSIPLSLILGTYSAINVKKLRGGAVDVVTQVGLAIPAFWGGLLLVLFFGVRHRLLPIGGYVPFSEDPIASIKSVILPIAALSIGVTAVFTRYVRTAMIDVMTEDFIKLAMAKGRTRRGAALHHGVRNASIPLVTVATLQLGALMAGAVVIENVFVIPGIGRLLVTSTLGREVVVVQSLTFVIMLMILTMNFLMDIAYGLLDPRMRDGQEVHRLA
jgi:peptide/nickel transport system permease protein